MSKHAIFYNQHEFIQELFIVNPMISPIEAYKLLFAKFGERSMTKRSVQNDINELKIKGSLGKSSLISSVDESFDIPRDEYKSKFEVDHTGYRINTKRGPIVLTIDRADELFYKFSEHGLNKTQTQIINEYGFEVWQWLSIKNTLSIYKKSNIFSQWTIDNTPKEDLENKIQQKLKYALEDKLNIESQYRNAVTKKWKKDISMQEVRELAFQKLTSEIIPIIKEANISKSIPVSNVKGTKHLVTATADWHIGAKVEGLINTPDYSPEILKGYVDQMADKINLHGARKVTLVIAGDIIESFTGKNHNNSFMSIDHAYYGANVVAKAYEMICYLISKTNNICEIIGIGGNHDRWSENSDLDTRGEVARIIFYMLNLSHGKKIDIKYGDNVYAKAIDGINYIVVHGDKVKDNAKPEKLIFDYGDPSMYNMIIGAHRHTRMITADHRRFRKVVIPPLFTGNDYSENLGFATLPGVTMIYNNGNGHPVVIDHPLEII